MSETASIAKKKDPSLKWMAILVAILSFMLYAPSLKSDLVYDASVQIASDDYIHTRSNLLDVFSFRVMSRDVLDFNRPVHLQSLMIDSLIWGRNPFGYHLTSNIIHAINAAVFFLLLVKIFEAYRVTRGKDGFDSYAKIAAFFGAILFAAHPACAEAVAEPSFREDPLATLFALLATFLATQIANENRRNIWLWVGIIVCSLYAIGSKEIGVATPIMVAGYFLLFRRDVNWRNWLIPVIGSAIICGLFTIARFAFEPKNSLIFGSGPRPMASDVANYLIVQGHIWRLNIEGFFWPFRLCADYTPDSIRDFSIAGSWMIVGSFILGQIILSCISRIALYGSICFWLAILPVSNILPQYHPAADRYLYMPAVGLAMIAASFLYWIGSQQALRGSIAVVMIALIGYCSWLTYQRQIVFSSPVALWMDTYQKNPKSYHAYNGLGYAFLYQGKLEPAKKWLQRASEINPRHPDPWCGLAVVADKNGEKHYALFLFKKCLQADPDYGSIELSLKKMKIDKPQAELIAPLIERMKQAQGN